MYIDNEEYMKAIVGDIDISRQYQMSRNMFKGTYNKANTINLTEPILNNIDLYPDSYININPIVINKCMSVTEKPTKELITKLVNEIYSQVNVNQNYRMNNDFLRDLIQILVLNQILKK